MAVSFYLVDSNVFMKHSEKLAFYTALYRLAT
jgi:hypothetical protein